MIRKFNTLVRKCQQNLEDKEKLQPWEKALIEYGKKHFGIKEKEFDDGNELGEFYYEMTESVIDVDALIKESLNEMASSGKLDLYFSRYCESIITRLGKSV